MGRYDSVKHVFNIDLDTSVEGGGGVTTAAAVDGDAGGNNGAVYKADNWKQIGKTAGLPKDRKAFSVKWDSAEHLKETFLPPTGEDKKLIFIYKLK